MIFLRPIKNSDFSFIYTLYSEESQIYWSGHLTKPNFDNLKNWFEKLIYSSENHRHIIQNSNRKVGFCKLELKSKECDVSISISEKFRGCGSGTDGIICLLKK